MSWAKRALDIVLALLLLLLAWPLLLVLAVLIKATSRGPARRTLRAGRIPALRRQHRRYARLDFLGLRRIASKIPPSFRSGPAQGRHT